MKNKKYIWIALLAGISIIASCKKKGCMEPLAVNYFSKATTDDGSCSYSTTRIAGLYGYIIDTLDQNASAYSLAISELKVAGYFDKGINEFLFHVDWLTKKMVMPDTLLPADTKCTGTVTDKDNFTVNLVYDPAGTINDTSITYTFIRK